MLRQYRVTVAVIALTIFTSGCRSTEEYQKLSKAGTDYTSALDSLLTVAGKTRIDVSSELLLRSRAFVPQTVDDYRKRTEEDNARLEVLEDIREHNRLLAKYFELINELASSKAPEQIQGEVGSIADNLNKIGVKLRKSPFIQNKDALQSISGLIVSSKIRGALGEELRKRKDTIALEFNTQKELLQALSDSVSQDIKIISEQQESRLVIRPFLSTAVVNEVRTSTPINASEWISARRTILTMKTTADELENASVAMNKFNEVFKDFVEGKLTQSRINSLLSDIESFVSVIEKLKPKEP
jgi:hypothetical protein